MSKAVPFNRPYMTGRELSYIAQAHQQGWLAGDGHFTKACHAKLEQITGAKKALLTHSCTAALEMAAILADIGPGDEIIMPSYTFVSTANAFVLRGGVPVFVDVREDTLNLDESLIRAAITPRTKAIVPVHYAGVTCAMDEIMAIAEAHSLLVIEDAAQAFLSSHKGQPAGSIGHLAALSFHETKNVISGEGGALLINDPLLVERAEIIREKGTNRAEFFRGEVDKYTWVDLGSSFLPSELVAAFLYAQLEDATDITRRRLALWNQYHSFLADFESRGICRRPTVPADCVHNGHLYGVRLPNLQVRSKFIEELKKSAVHSVFHYVPLHSSPAGRRFGRTAGPLPVTDRIANQLVRLPLWIGLQERQREVLDLIAERLAEMPVANFD